MNRNKDKLFFSNLIKLNDPTAADFNPSDLEVDICESVSSFDMDAMWECDTNPNQKDRIDAPTYSKNFDSVLQDPEKEDPGAKLNKAPHRNSCFNCLGDHLMTECPKPRDQRAITKNRREFMNKSSGFFRQASRYHLGEDQVYAHMVPGQISDSLRFALGLSEHQLPLHIYRMRMFGYPPGWLEDARVSRSGIALYADSRGTEIPSPDDEDGEIVTDGSKDSYDVSKIHEFPGFNVPPHPATIDEYRYYRCPPQLEEQSKETMLKYLENEKATAASYKKRALISTNLPPGKILIECDGDSDCTPEATGSSPEEATTDKPSSPSLEDLEAQKQNLMAELLRKSAAAELASNSIDMETLPTKKKKKGKKLKKDNQIPDMDSGENDNPRTISPSSAEDKLSTPTVKHVAVGTPGSDRSTPYSRNCVTPVTKIGTVKHIEQGTPILKSASPYSLLPSPDNFSKNICDVINFENLPDSLGHYERMNQVIHSVRDRLKRQ